MTLQRVEVTLTLVLHKFVFTGTMQTDNLKEFTDISHTQI